MKQLILRNVCVKRHNIPIESAEILRKKVALELKSLDCFKNERE